MIKINKYLVKIGSISTLSMPIVVLACGVDNVLYSESIEYKLLADKKVSETIEFYPSYFKNGSSNKLSELFNDKGKNIINKSKKIFYTVKWSDDSKGELTIEARGIYKEKPWKQEFDFNNLYKKVKYVSDLPSKLRDKYYDKFGNNDRKLFNDDFKNFKKIEADFQIPSQFTSIGKGYFSNIEISADIDIPSSIISIEDSAFENSKIKGNISILDSIKTWGSYIFANSIIEGIIDIENFKTVPSYMFKNVDLTKVKIDFSKINKIEEGGLYKSKLPEDFNIENIIEIGRLSFENTIINFDFSKLKMLKKIGYEAFGGATFLSPVIIPEVFTSISPRAFVSAIFKEDFSLHKNIKNIGESAFSHTTFMKDFKSNNSGFTLGNAAFAKVNMANAISFKLEDGLKTIPFYAFFKAKLPNNFSIPNSVFEIGGAAFAHTTLNDSFTLPTSLTKLDKYAFYKSSNNLNIDNNKYDITNFYVDDKKWSNEGFSLEDIIDPPTH